MHIEEFAFVGKYLESMGKSFWNQNASSYVGLAVDRYLNDSPQGGIYVTRACRPGTHCWYVRGRKRIDL